jgi:hypothetical protein
MKIQEDAGECRKIQEDAGRCRKLNISIKRLPFLAAFLSFSCLHPAFFLPFPAFFISSSSAFQHSI